MARFHRHAFATADTCRWLLPDKPLGCSTGLAHRAQAAGADVDADANSIDNESLLLDVRSEIPVRASLRETYVMSKCLGLATDVAFAGHGRTPFDCSLAAIRVLDLGRCPHMRTS